METWERLGQSLRLQTITRGRRLGYLLSVVKGVNGEGRLEAAGRWTTDLKGRCRLLIPEEIEDAVRELAVCKYGAGMMRKELESVLIAAQTVSRDELPRLLGDLEEVRATALTRLISPTPIPTPDMLLDVDKAAERLGMSPDYLYRNHRRFPFTKRMGRSLRFSAQGIERYLRH